MNLELASSFLNASFLFDSNLGSIHTIKCFLSGHFEIHDEKTLITCAFSMTSAILTELAHLSVLGQNVFPVSSCSWKWSNTVHKAKSARHDINT